MNSQARLACMGLAMLAAGCQAGAPRAACPLPGQTRMTSLKLYFGRNVPGGSFVTDEAFAGFAAAVLTPAFPDGFTVYEALGQWRNPRDGQIVREKSFVVESIGPHASAEIDKVTGAYKQVSHQISVGEVSQDVCAAF